MARHQQNVYYNDAFEGDNYNGQRQSGTSRESQDRLEDPMSRMEEIGYHDDNRFDHDQHHGDRGDRYYQGISEPIEERGRRGQDHQVRDENYRGYEDDSFRSDLGRNARSLDFDHRMTDNDRREYPGNRHNDYGQSGKENFEGFERDNGRRNTGLDVNPKHLDEEYGYRTRIEGYGDENNGQTFENFNRDADVREYDIGEPNRGMHNYRSEQRGNVIDERDGHYNHPEPGRSAQNSDYYSTVDEGAHAYDRSHLVPQQTQVDQFVDRGHENVAYDESSDFEEERRIRQRVQRQETLYGKKSVRMRSRKFKSRRRRRTGARSEMGRVGVSLADGLQTLRVRSMAVQSIIDDDDQSDRGRGGRSREEGIYQQLDDDPNKLPSNRNLKTVTLKRKIQILHKERELNTHAFAAALRDQIVTEPQKDLKGWKLFKTNMATNWQAFKGSAKNMKYSMEPWAGAFKVIEGHFGTATMSYFRFLRWLMFLNLYLAIIMICLTIVPFVALRSNTGDFTSSVNACTSPFHFEALYYSTNYTDGVAAVKGNESVVEAILDILLGTGWVMDTELFYGRYHNLTFTVPLLGQTVYNMSFSYLLAMGLAFTLCFLLLVKNSAKSFKQGVLNSSGGTLTQHCNKVFGGWDYCISDSSTAILKKKNIFQEYSSDLECQRMEWKKAGRTRMERTKLYLTRIIINILVLIILGGSLYLIYFTNELLLKLSKDNAGDEVTSQVMQYLPSITITILNFIVPVVFTKLILAEDYMPAFKVRLTLFRTVLLRLASVGVLMLSLYNTLGKGKKKNVLDYPPCLHYESPTNTTNSQPLTNDDLCWETYVGQQIYKLLTLNFLVVVILTFLWEFPRRKIFKTFGEKYKVVKMLGQQEFDLNKSVLDLVYLQTLCWLGMFFSPLIPIMCFIKCFVFFYVKKLSLLHNCLPQPQVGASRSNSLFMMVLLMSFALSAVPITFMIGSIPPSQGCGPFRVYSSEDFIMFKVVSNVIKEWPSDAQLVFFQIGSVGFMVVFIFIVCLMMYYYWAVGQGYRRMTKLLRDQLKVEGQDKQFLLARLNEALQPAET